MSSSAFFTAGSIGRAGAAAQRRAREDLMHARRAGRAADRPYFCNSRWHPTVVAALSMQPQEIDPFPGKRLNKRLSAGSSSTSRGSSICSGRLFPPRPRLVWHHDIRTLGARAAALGNVQRRHNRRALRDVQYDAQTASHEFAKCGRRIHARAGPKRSDGTHRDDNSNHHRRANLLCHAKESRERLEVMR